MTVAATPYKESYAGNGVTTVFSVPFYFLADTDLVVSDVNNTTGVVTPLVLNVGYTVTGTGTPTGGAVTVTTATATGHTITIERSLVEDQPTHFVDGDPLPASGLEQALDRIVMLYQQAKAALDRSAKFVVGSTSTTDLPEPAEGYVLGWVSGKLRNLAAASAQLAADLLNAVSGAKGAALVWFDKTLTYAAGTVGSFLNDLGTAATTKGAALIGYLAPYTGAVGRTVQSRLTDRLTAKDYGVIGDGLADDHSALQAYITNLQAAGKVIRLPEGTFLISSSLVIASGQNNELEIEGAGEYKTIIKAITNTFPIFQSVAGNAISNVNIKDLQIQGGTWGVYIQPSGLNAASLFDFKNVRFFFQTVGAVYCAQYMLIFNFTKVTFFYCSNGVFCGRGANLNNFIDCRFEGLSGYCVCFVAPDGQTGFGGGIGGQSNLFLGCRFEARNVAGMTNGTFTASCSGSTLTLTSAATGTFILGQPLFGAGIPNGTIINTLLSGNLGSYGSTYSLSKTPGTIVSEAMTSGGVNVILQSCANTVFKNCYVEDSYKTFLNEQYSNGTTVFENNWFTGAEYEITPAGFKPDVFVSDGVVTFNTNSFMSGSIGTPKQSIHGDNFQLTSYSSEVWSINNDSRIAVTTKTHTVASGVAQDLFTFTAAFPGVGIYDTASLAGVLTVVVEASTSGGSPSYISQRIPILIRQFASQPMVVVFGTAQTADDNAANGSLSVVQKAGATNTSTTISATYVLGSFGIGELRAYLDVVSLHNSTRLALSVTPL